MPRWYRKKLGLRLESEKTDGGIELSDEICASHATVGLQPRCVIGPARLCARQWAEGTPRPSVPPALKKGARYGGPVCFMPSLFPPAETDCMAEDAVQYERVSQIRIPTISGKIVGILQVLVPEMPILGLAW